MVILIFKQNNECLNIYIYYFIFIFIDVILFCLIFNKLKYIRL